MWNLLFFTLRQFVARGILVAVVKIAAVFKIAAPRSDKLNELMIHVVVDFKGHRKKEKLGLVTVPLDEFGVSDKAQRNHV